MKKAVILFNLGGPDKLENVEPFLFNLFNDPAILNLPSFFRGADFIFYYVPSIKKKHA